MPSLYSWRKKLVIASLLFLTATLHTACAVRNDEEPPATKTVDHEKALNSCEGQQQIRFANLNACGELAWTTGPDVHDESQALLTLKSLSGEPLQLSPSANIKLSLWMPSMGHGSAPTSSETLSPGVFKLTQIFFIMAGEWELRFEIRDTEKQNTVIDSARLAVDLKP